MSEEIKPGYTRVSSILSQWDRFGHIDKNILENKKILGTCVHEAIKEYFLCGFHPMESDIKGYFLSFLKWYNDTSVNIIQSEERYYDEDNKITGCIDGLVQFPNDKEFVLIDFKTSVAEDKKFWPLQGQMYHDLMRKNGKELSNRFLFLILSKDGNLPKVCEYKTSNLYAEICRAAILTYRYINN